MTMAQEKDEAPPAATKVGFAGRLLALPKTLLSWMLANRLRVLLLSAACVVSLSGVGAGAWFLFGRAPEKPKLTIEMALEALDNAHFAEAESIAKRLQADATFPPKRLGEPAFVLGAIAAHEAAEMLSTTAADRYLVAARYLEDACERGVPEGREAEASYLLGRSLVCSEQYVAARDALQQALEIDPENESARYLLAAAYLADAEPQLEDALAQNALVLKSDRVLPEMRTEALLQRAEILLRLGKLAESHAALESLPTLAQGMAETIVLRGRLLIAEADALAAKGESEKPGADAKYKAAMDTLRKVEGRDTLHSQATSKALYLTGVCLLGMGDQAAALAQFSRTAKLCPGTVDAQASEYREAEILARTGKTADATEAMRRLLLSVKSAESFSNPWITLAEVRSAALTAYQQLLSGRNYAQAANLAEATAGAFSPARAVELSAEAHQSWAIALTAEANQAHAGVGETRQRAREQYRLAAGKFAQLAELQSVTRQYPDYLWSAATCYHQGQDYRHAVRLAREYLKNEARQRHAQALVLLGESLLALNRVDEALRAFQECIEFHARDAAAYRARYLASRAWQEKGEIGKAEELLLENVSGENLTPASKEWRDSLFALGELLHSKGQYAEAVARLDEAVSRYAQSPQALEGRYLLADSYRQMARVMQDKLRQGLAGRDDLSLTPEVVDLYQQALGRYRELQEILVHKQEKEELGPLEKELLKNCVFAVGAIDMELEQYDQAIKSYMSVATRYQNMPEALDAYVQIAKAYRRIGKTSEARSTLEQAKVVLNRMKPEHAFEETTNYNRAEWSAVLEGLSQL